MSKCRFYVGFSSSTYKHKWLFKKGYEHCYLLMCDDTYWYEINPLMMGLHMKRVAKQPSNYTSFWMEKNSDDKLLEVEIRIDKPKHKIPFIGTCASLVSYITGLNFTCFTPYGLYKNIMKGKGNIISVQEL